MNKLFLSITIILTGACYLSGAKFQTIIGSVKYQKQGAATIQKATMETKLYTGDAIITEANSTASILILDDSSILNIFPNSKVVISETTKKEKSVPAFVLFLGKIKAKITKLQKNEETVDFNTPTAVIGVRGTDFDLGVAEDGTSKVGVSEGKVEVKGEKRSIGLVKAESTIVGLSSEPMERIPYSTLTDDWNTWFVSVSEKIKGKEKSILTAIKNKLASCIKQIDGYKEEQNKLENEKTKLKLEIENLKKENKEPQAKEKVIKLVDIAALKGRNVIQMNHLDILSAAIYETAQRIYNKSDKTDPETSQTYKEIELSYNQSHSFFATPPANVPVQKKSWFRNCIGLGIF